jgi:hypothetical protein
MDAIHAVELNERCLAVLSCIILPGRLEKCLSWSWHAWEVVLQRSTQRWQPLVENEVEGKSSFAMRLIF